MIQSTACCLDRALVSGILFTDYLLRLDCFKKAKVLRVYSKIIEHDKYPVPRELIIVKKHVSNADKERIKKLRPITLHHLIHRDPDLDSDFESNSDSDSDSQSNYGSTNCRVKRISDMDKRIKRDPQGLHISDDEISQYLKDIEEEQNRLLGHADVILCTCSASSAKRIVANTNIVQVCNLPFVPFC